MVAIGWRTIFRPEINDLGPQGRNFKLAVPLWRSRSDVPTVRLRLLRNETVRHKVMMQAQLGARLVFGFYMGACRPNIVEACSAASMAPGTAAFRPDTKWYDKVSTTKVSQGAAGRFHQRLDSSR